MSRVYTETGKAAKSIPVFIIAVSDATTTATDNGASTAHDEVTKDMSTTPYTAILQGTSITPGVSTPQDTTTTPEVSVPQDTSTTQEVSIPEDLTTAPEVSTSQNRSTSAVASLPQSTPPSTAGTDLTPQTGSRTHTSIIDSTLLSNTGKFTVKHIHQIYYIIICLRGNEPFLI